MRMARIKNWAEFQHYKDRSPPWIKLHRALLDDFDFQCLPVASRALAPMLWLLAAEHTDGLVCVEPDRIAFRLRMTAKEAAQAVTPLIEKRFLILASDTLADCKQVAIPETETETETEKSNDPPNGGSSASADADAPTKSDSIPYKAIIDGYNRELPNLGKARELTPKRRSLIRSAWQASPDRRSLDFWNAYWAECAADDFLNGTGPYHEPHATWRPGFDYLLRADVVTRTFERAMDRLERCSEAT